MAILRKLPNYICVSGISQEPVSILQLYLVCIHPMCVWLYVNKKNLHLINIHELMNISRNSYDIDLRAGTCSELGLIDNMGPLGNNTGQVRKWAKSDS